ncbi:MAG: hypothetical protein LBL66_05455 [Clostridiales bacterium]|jgi:multidrug transporter EmrE-like cation transporter|nr:hypothetical protein [Clostridiales bacterium]
MQYLFLASAVIMFSVYGMVSAVYSRRADNRLFLYLAFVALGVALFFLAYNRFAFVFDWPTAAYSLLFGAAFLSAVLFMVKAQKIGNVAITALVINLSMFLPTLFGIFAYDGTVGGFFFIGIALLAGAVVLFNLPGKAKTESVSGFSDTAPPQTLAAGRAEAAANIRQGRKRNRLLWAAFTFTAFTANGACGIFQMIQQKTRGGAFKAEFMIAASAVVFLAAAAALLFGRAKIGRAALKVNAPFGAAAGILTAATNLFVMLLVSGGALPLGVIYPLIAAGGLAVAYIVSMAVFREKMPFLKHIAFLLGVVSIVFFNL